MKKNIGTADRVARIAIGVACLVGVYLSSSIIVSIVLFALGAFSIYEALVGWCAFYALIGRNTCPIE